jgi:hypothetical protein
MVNLSLGTGAAGMNPHFRSILCMALLWLASCQELKEYQGSWSGPVEQSRLVRRGIDLCTLMELDIRRVAPTHLEASFVLKPNPDLSVCSADLPDEGPVLDLPTDAVPLSLVPELLNDALSGLQIEGDPLFTHIGWISLDGKPAIFFLSVFRDLKLELRLSSPEIYAMFKLRKSRD